jgi:hypothetical protein
MLAETTTKPYGAHKPVCEATMSTWWEQRVARVTEAASIVAHRTGCPMGDALSILRQRAELDGMDLEEVAETVIREQTRLDYRDLVASDVTPVRQKATVAPR